MGIAFCARKCGGEGIGALGVKGASLKEALREGAWGDSRYM